MLPPEAGGDPSDFFRGLLFHRFWFPVTYHPELDDPWEPGEEDEIPFWTDQIPFLVAESRKEEFIAIYSAPELMRMALEPLERRYSRARMKGADLFVALRDTDHPLIINPWPDTAIILPAYGVRTLGHNCTKGVARLRQSRRRPAK